MQTQMLASHFHKGAAVEVTKQNSTCYYPATVLRAPAKHKNLVFLEYLTLFVPHEYDASSNPKPLREYINVASVRPKLPHQLNSSFMVGDSVDAYRDSHNAWCPATVLHILENSRYTVSFRGPNDTDCAVIEQCCLRLHRNWVDGNWVPPLPQKNSSELAKKFGDMKSKAKNLSGNKLILKFRKSRELAKKPGDVTSRTKNSRSKFVLHFCKGAKVEVRSDEEGYQGAWYTAIVVDSPQNGKYLVEYLTLKTDDLTEQLKEEADASDIRPYPPDIIQHHRFALHERVDAWYNDGWWVGQVSSVLCGLKYRVYFWPTKEELEFEHCHLRPHQEWIDGRWVLASMG